VAEKATASTSSTPIPTTNTTRTSTTQVSAGFVRQWAGAQLNNPWPGRTRPRPASFELEL
jgi:hypothetical protein